MSARLFFLSLIIFVFIHYVNINVNKDVAFAKMATKKCEVMLIFDNSGSMKRFDPHGLRYEAVKTFITLMNKNFAVGVISFGKGVRDIYSLTFLKSEDVKSQIISAIYQLKSNEQFSDLKQALLYAESKFSTTGSEKYIILISDGFPDPFKGSKDKDDLYIRKTLSGSLSKDKIQVIPIGFTPKINLTLYSDLAEKTGGKLYTYKTPEQLTDGFINILQKINKQITYCIPECIDKQCGDDSCGSVCGKCKPEENCVDGKCICEPKCEKRDCGVDGCGGFCGQCEESEFCDQSYHCVPRVSKSATKTGISIFTIIITVFIVFGLLFVAFFIFLKKRKTIAMLVPLADNPYKETININKKSFIVGRSPAVSDYVINDPKVSKQHFKIVFKDKKFFIQNLSKTNRTQLLNIMKTLLFKEVENIDDNDKILLVRYTKGITSIEIAYQFKIKKHTKSGKAEQSDTEDKTEAITTEDIEAYIDKHPVSHSNIEPASNAFTKKIEPIQDEGETKLINRSAVDNLMNQLPTDKNNTKPKKKPEPAHIDSDPEKTSALDGFNLDEIMKQVSGGKKQPQNSDDNGEKTMLFDDFQPPTNKK